MTTALYDEVVTITPARKLRVVREVTPARMSAPKKVAPRSDDQFFDASGDPLVDGVARLLTIPVRHVYAALWRVGLLEIQA